MSRSSTAREPLDDGHLTAAAGADMLLRLRLLRGVFDPCVRIGIDGLNGVDRNYRRRGEQQFAGARDVLGTLAAGEQAIVTNAVEACGQHMDQKAADVGIVGGGTETVRGRTCRSTCR